MNNSATISILDVEVGIVVKEVAEVRDITLLNCVEQWAELSVFLDVDKGTTFA